MRERTRSAKIDWMSTDAPGEWRSEFDGDVHADTVWTAANIQEALPGLITPLTWSLMRRVLDYAFAQPARRIGVYSPPADPFVALFYGRAFLNASALRAGAALIPFSSAAAMDENYLGVARAPDRRIDAPSLPRVVRSLPVIVRMVWVILRAAADIRSAERLVREAEVRDRRLNLESLEAAALVRELEDGTWLARPVAATHIGVSANANVAFEWLGYATSAWLDDAHGSLRAVLCTGLTSVESARAAQALWQVAVAGRRSPLVPRALEAQDAEAALAGLRRSADAAVRDFVTAYDAFLRRFGHRSVMEVELAARAWEDDPAAVFGLLRTLLHAGPESDPDVIESRQRRTREAATRRVLARLSLPRRLFFRRLLAEAQRYIVYRERTKSTLVRGANRARRLARLFGRRLAESGRITRPDDVFYLTIDEARDLASGVALPDLDQRIERRRAEERRNRDVLLPQTFSGHPRPIRPDAVSTGRELRGIPVSPGRISGRARVIIDPRSHPGLEAGEVLVAPVTDAAWTPLFLAAAAIVVEVGGPLSHGAIVARELGLPAVVNVTDATRRIRTGQRITVDGRAGTVHLEES